MTSLHARRGLGVGELGPLTAPVNNAGWDKIFSENDPSGTGSWRSIVGVFNDARRARGHGGARRRARRVDRVRRGPRRVDGRSGLLGCKAASSVSKSLAREVARKGITVNVVVRAHGHGALAEVGASEQGAKIVAGLERAIPLRRLGKPEDVAGAVAYLVSDEAAFVTGQVLSVSGGLSMVG